MHFVLVQTLETATLTVLLQFHRLEINYQYSEVVEGQHCVWFSDVGIFIILLTLSCLRANLWRNQVNNFFLQSVRKTPVEE